MVVGTRGAEFPAHPETSFHHVVGLGFLQHRVVCVHFFGFVEPIHRLIQLPGPGLGHGNKRNHHKSRARHGARNAQ